MSKILLVDDDPGIREVMASCLADQGHEVTSACSGDSAVELLPTVNPDLVLTDIRMGPGDGYHVLATVKKYDPLIAVITMSGHASTASDIVTFLKLGADDHLCKPFTLDELDRRIAYELRYRRSQLARNAQLGQQA